MLTQKIPKAERPNLSAWHRKGIKQIPNVLK
jgi:hypothetical protein